MSSVLCAAPLQFPRCLPYSRRSTTQRPDSPVPLEYPILLQPYHITTVTGCGQSCRTLVRCKALQGAQECLIYQQLSHGRTGRGYSHWRRHGRGLVGPWHNAFFFLYYIQHCSCQGSQIVTSLPKNEKQTNYCAPSRCPRPLNAPRCCCSCTDGAGPIPMLLTHDLRNRGVARTFLRAMRFGDAVRCR